jgi:hypothetical protein
MMEAIVVMILAVAKADEQRSKLLDLGSLFDEERGWGCMFTSLFVFLCMNLPVYDRLCCTLLW